MGEAFHSTRRGHLDAAQAAVFSGPARMIESPDVAQQLTQASSFRIKQKDPSGWSLACKPRKALQCRETSSIPRVAAHRLGLRSPTAADLCSSPQRLPKEDWSQRVCVFGSMSSPYHATEILQQARSARLLQYTVANLASDSASTTLHLNSSLRMLKSAEIVQRRLDSASLCRWRRTITKL